MNKANADNDTITFFELSLHGPFGIGNLEAVKQQLSQGLEKKYLRLQLPEFHGEKLFPFFQLISSFIKTFTRDEEKKFILEFSGSFPEQWQSYGLEKRLITGYKGGTEHAE